MTPDDRAAFRAERAREDARDAIAQGGVATPAEHALIGCRCESCKAAVLATMAYLKERDEAARALKDAADAARDRVLVASWGLDADSLCGAL